MQTISSIDVLELSKLNYDSYSVIRGCDNFGKLFNINEYQYSGELNENNLPHGTGEMEYFNHPTLKCYIGDFVNGEKCGLGREIYTNDDIYAGTFVNGTKDGIGKMYTSNGLLKYDGIWVNGDIIGDIIGYEYKNNKKIYYGCMKNGNYHGYGVEYDDNCIIRIGYYEDGKIIKSIELYKNKNTTIVKEAPTEFVDIITDKINNIYNNDKITLDEIKEFDNYMIGDNMQDITRKNEKNEIVYIGSIKIIDGIKYNDVGTYYTQTGLKYIFTFIP